MVTLELDAELAARDRAVILSYVRALIPRCDPDGRGRIEIHVGADPGAGTRVEVTCEVPWARAIAIGEDPTSALRRAFGRIAALLGDSTQDGADAPPQAPRLPTS